MKHLRVASLALLIFIHSIGISQSQKNTSLSHETKTYGVELAVYKPELADFWLDSMGKGRKWTNGMLGDSSKQTYQTAFENGGASANHAYYTLAALYMLGRHTETDRILFPILKSFDENPIFLRDRIGEL